MINPFNPLFDLYVLVVDDQIPFIEKFKTVVASFGHNASGTWDTTEAIKMVKEAYENLNPFDVAFIDYLMPDMNGIELARELKKIDPDLILIALTRDKSKKTKMAIINSLDFRLLISKDIDIVKLEKLFNILVSTKLEQFSGDESRFYRKIEQSQLQARERKDREKAGEI